MKKCISCFLTIIILLSCSSCSLNSKQEKYSGQFFGTFDTIVSVIGYANDEKQFKYYYDYIQNRFTELNQLFDIYYNYLDINNIKTINDNAGIQPVVVNQEIIDLLDFCIEWNSNTNGKVNIALGPVLKIWHSYMERYSGSDEDGKLPLANKLTEAKKNTDISRIQIDHTNNTVYLEENMSIDVGAVAKGYAAEIVCDEVYELGFHSFILSAGGNVVVKDPPVDKTRNAWGISIQNPFFVDGTSDNSTLDVIYVNNESIVTSGDYQRYYVANGERIHHIIDTETLYPAKYYRSVTIMTEDSGLADLASTTLFCLDFDESYSLAEQMNWKVLWVFPDNTIKYTNNFVPYLKEIGKANNGNS